MTAQPTRLFFVADGQRLPISNMFDLDGQETADPDLAVTVVVPMPDGRWMVSECRAGDIQRGWQGE